MNLLINCSNLKMGGGLQVAHSFIHELKKYPQHNYVVVCSSQFECILSAETFPSHIQFYQYNIKLIGKKSNSFLDNLIKKQNIDKVFTIFGPSYWVPKIPHVCGYAKPQYIYKDSPFFTRLNLRSRLKLHIKEIIHLFYFKQADVLITENKDVSDKLERLLPNKKIITVTNYYNQVFEQKEQWDKSIQLPILDGLTLLTISANYPHKNLNIIPRVITILNKTKPDLKFRFILSINENDLKVDNSEQKKHIIFLGKIHVNQCPYLYEQSDIMFLPTLLECFSASYAEAMFMKTPILTSGLGFAKGLCGKAALYFDPLSPQDIAGKIITLSEEKNLQKTLIKEGIEQLKRFDTYVERAKKYLDIIENTTS